MWSTLRCRAFNHCQQGGESVTTPVLEILFFSIPHPTAYKSPKNAIREGFSIHDRFVEDRNRVEPLPDHSCT
uniref:Uncharacterized protein n=1 Tax=Steinernema glaseri TaxID=37863 RepID=A0A1I7YMX5_9BILA